MATIITIASSDRFEPTSREAINDNFAAVNNELVTKLPLAGGTMSGDINMNGKKVTNLPAPTDNAEPARKLDVDGKVGKTGDETIAGTKTFSTTPVVPDASFGRAKLKAGRRVQMLMGVVKSGTTYLRISDVAIAHQFRMRRAGCIVGLTVYAAGTPGVNLVGSNSYVSSGTASGGRFGDGNLIGFNRNTSTGVVAIKIDTTSVSLTTSGEDGDAATADLNVMIEVELDD